MLLLCWVCPLTSVDLAWETGTSCYVSSQKEPTPAQRQNEETAGAKNTLCFLKSIGCPPLQLLDSCILVSVILSIQHPFHSAHLALHSCLAGFFQQLSHALLFRFYFDVLSQNSSLPGPWNRAWLSLCACTMVVIRLLIKEPCGNINSEVIIHW